MHSRLNLHFRAGFSLSLLLVWCRPEIPKLISRDPVASFSGNIYRRVPTSFPAAMVQTLNQENDDDEGDDLHKYSTWSPPFTLWGGGEPNKSYIHNENRPFFLPHPGVLPCILLLLNHFYKDEPGCTPEDERFSPPLFSFILVVSPCIPEYIKKTPWFWLHWTCRIFPPKELWMKKGRKALKRIPFPLLFLLLLRS